MDSGWNGENGGGLEMPSMGMGDSFMDLNWGSLDSGGSKWQSSFDGDLGGVPTGRRTSIDNVQGSAEGMDMPLGDFPLDASFQDQEQPTDFLDGLKQGSDMKESSGLKRMDSGPEAFELTPKKRRMAPKMENLDKGNLDDFFNADNQKAEEGILTDAKIGPGTGMSVGPEADLLQTPNKERSNSFFGSVRDTDTNAVRKPNGYSAQMNPKVPQAPMESARIGFGNKPSVMDNAAPTNQRLDAPAARVVQRNVRTPQMPSRPGETKPMESNGGTAPDLSMPRRVPHEADKIDMGTPGQVSTPITRSSVGDIGSAFNSGAELSSSTSIRKTVTPESPQVLDPLRSAQKQDTSTNAIGIGQRQDVPTNAVMIGRRMNLDHLPDEHSATSNGQSINLTRGQSADLYSGFQHTMGSQKEMMSTKPAISQKPLSRVAQLKNLYVPDFVSRRGGLSSILRK